MSKKRLGIVGGFVLAGVLLGSALFFGREKSAGENIPAELESVSVEQAGEIEELSYEDEAGFSFKHPENFTVEDITPEKKEYYTLLEVGKAENKANRADLIKIEIKDVQYGTIGEWMSGDSSAPEKAELIGAVSLDGMPASQYSEGEKLYTIAVDGEILYLVEADVRVEEAYNLLVDSFKFLSEKEDVQGGSGAGGSIIYEPEEVVE